MSYILIAFVLANICDSRCKLKIEFSTGGGTLFGGIEFSMVITEEEAVLKESEIPTKLSVSGVNVLLERERAMLTHNWSPLK